MNTITRLGRALYGDRWISLVAADLRISERTVRRWAAGTYEPPATVLAELRAIVAKRAADMVEIARD